GVVEEEGDGLRRGVLGRHDEIAFVLAVLVVDDHDDLPAADGRDGVFDGCEGHCSPSGGGPSVPVAPLRAPTGRPTGRGAAMTSPTEQRGTARWTPTESEPSWLASDRRPAGVDDDTVAAVGKLGEALEWVERARGRLYDFHQ